MQNIRHSTTGHKGLLACFNRESIFAHDGNQAGSGRGSRNFPKEYLGYAQSAFFGGRTSAHIRKMPVPVVYTDFLSMYPTVNSLMDLWRFVTARKIKVVEHCQAEIQIFLQQIDRSEFAELFNQETWKELPAFVQDNARRRYSAVPRQI